MSEGVRPGKRVEVLSEAARLFVISGFHGTSMDDIAAALGFTKAALYHYFGSKSDILYEIYAAVCAEVAARLERHSVELGPVDRLHQTMRDVMSVVAEMPNEVTVFLQEGPLLSSCLPRRQARELRAREDEFTNYVIEAVEDGIAAGTIRALDPTLTAFAFIGMVSWTARWYRAGGPTGADEIADLFFDIGLHGAGFNVQG